MPFNAQDYDRRERRAEDKSRRLHVGVLPVQPEFQRYFGSQLHDSYVIGTEREGNRFTVRLSHDGTGDCIADPLGKLLALELRDQIWPIHLVFSDVTYLRWAQETKTGDFRFARPQWRPVEDRPRADSFLFDRFTQENGKLQWLAEFWADNPHGPGKSIYLMLECSSCRVEDLREATFVKCFGERWRPLWKEIEANYPDMFYYQSDVKQLIKERVG